MRGIRELCLFNPWTHCYHVYRLDITGFKQLRCFGPVSKRDAQRVIKDYRDKEPK